MIILHPHLKDYKHLDCRISKFEQMWVAFLCNDSLEKKELNLQSNPVFVSVYYEKEIPVYIHKQLGQLNYFVEVENWMLNIWIEKRNLAPTYKKSRMEIRQERFSRNREYSFSRKKKEFEIYSETYENQNYLLNLMDKKMLV